METEDCLLGEVKAVMNDGGGPRRHPRGKVSCGPRFDRHITVIRGIE